ncbi:MAG: chemotaxis protein methyltransferase CheR [Candidatus Hydrogenedentes bacterium]|nr:chemotaxis protein methyltransferase CheR [Candidatus Hydrogenedentota bacterium]
MQDIGDEEFALLKAHLLGVSGIDILVAKRYLFVTRLKEFLDKHRFASFREFYYRLHIHKDEALEKQLVESMITNETSFCRDVHPFETLQTAILPEAAARKTRIPHGFPKRLRILSAGCSTGQEPYSIGAAVLEWLEGQHVFRPDDITVLAIDISPRVLDFARRGTYEEADLGRGLPPIFQLKYFRRKGPNWEVCDALRRMVNFHELNLSQPFGHLGAFDCIFCRNVIIYFSMGLKQRIVDQFHTMLSPSGALILGASESLYNISEKFAARNEGKTLFYEAK